MHNTRDEVRRQAPGVCRLPSYGLSMGWCCGPLNSFVCAAAATPQLFASTSRAYALRAPGDELPGWAPARWSATSSHERRRLAATDNCGQDTDEMASASDQPTRRSKNCVPLGATCAGRSSSLLACGAAGGTTRELARVAGRHGQPQAELVTAVMDGLKGLSSRVIAVLGVWT